MTGMQEERGYCTSSWIRADGVTVFKYLFSFHFIYMGRFLLRMDRPFGDKPEDLIQNAKVLSLWDEKGRAYRSKAALLSQEDFTCHVLCFNVMSCKTLIIPFAAYGTFTQPGWTLPSVCPKGVQNRSEPVRSCRTSLYQFCALTTEVGSPNLSPCTGECCLSLLYLNVLVSWGIVT